MSRPRELLTIVVSRSTWRRCAHLPIGAAPAAPYGMLAPVREIEVAAALRLLGPQLELTNPLDGALPRAGGGRGLHGIHERVTRLHGQVSAGPGAGRWRVAVRLPLHRR